MAALLVLAAAVAACGGPAPSATVAAPASTPAASSSPAAAAASPSAPPPASTAVASPSVSAPAASQDPAAIVADIASQTEAIRGLAARAAITPRFIDEATLKKLLAADMDKQQSAQQLADTELLYRGLGLFGGDRSLRDVYLEMLGSQVLGFYRQQDKTLYVVQRAGGSGTGLQPIEEYTVSHELTHALQDQHFGIDTLALDQPDQGDRDLARRALLEGDASYASTLWSQQHLSLGDLLTIVQAASDPAQAKLTADLPPILRETTLFPYQDGLEFVMGLWTAGGWEAVDGAYAVPPDSTEQILHPAKYSAGEKPIPVIPSTTADRIGAGWTLALEDTLGELQLRVLLQTANDDATATAAASDWGGDRVALYHGPGGAWAIVLDTAWDTPAAVARFRPAAEAVAAALPHARVIDGAQGPAIVVGSDAGVLAKVGPLVGTH